MLDEKVIDQAAEAVADAAPDLTPPVGRSLVDRVRERHARRRRYLDLSIPQWDGDVVARYGPIPKKAIMLTGKRKLSATASNAELLVAACLEVFIRDERGELRPAREADGLPAPIRFDGRLADLFEMKNIRDERDILIRMYADDTAIGAQAQRVLAWQTGEGLDDVAEQEVEDDLGEADAAT